MSAGLIDEACVAPQTGKTEGVVEALSRLASIASFFRSADGRFFAQVPVEDRHEIYWLQSTAFRDWLVESYRCERGELPPAGVVKRVVDSLEARARFDNHTPAVHVRVGRDGESRRDDIYIDLGDRSGRAVKINGRGWLMVDRPPVKFRRPGGLLPLPAVSGEVPRGVRATSRWPKTPRALTNELRRIAPQLRARGISVAFSRTAESRLITICADPSIDYSCVMDN